MKKYRREVSPERSKVWTEKSPKYQQNPRNVKVAVVSLSHIPLILFSFLNFFLNYVFLFW